MTWRWVMWWTIWWLSVLAVVCLMLAAFSPTSRADPSGGGIGGGGNDVDINADIGGPGGGTVLILCPGVGTGANVLGGGGGYCDYDFRPSGMHIHCEWGGFAPVAGGWQCWRVFRGQPDHPRLPDPDIVPDGAPPRPDALRGPSPNDQAPPEPADIAGGAGTG